MGFPNMRKHLNTLLCMIAYSPSTSKTPQTWSQLKSILSLSFKPSKITRAKKQILQYSQTQQCTVFSSFLAQSYHASKSKNKGLCKSSRSRSLWKKSSSNASFLFMTQRRVTWRTSASRLIAGRLHMLSCKTTLLSWSRIKWLIFSKSS